MIDDSTHQDLRRRLAEAETALAKTRTEAAFHGHDEQLHHILEAMTEGFALFDANFTVLEVNAETLRLTRRTRDELVGTNHWEAFPGSENSALGAMYKRVMRDRVSDTIEHEYQWPDGRTMWVDVRTFPTTLGRIGCLWRDITDRKRAETALREGEKRQAFLLRLSDTLRAEMGADAVALCALRMMSQEMQLDRSYITVYRPDENRADVIHQIGNERVPPLPDMFTLSDYPKAFEAVHDKTFVVEDDFERRGLSEAEKRNSEALGMRAMLAATLRKGARHPLWSMMAISARPRRWTSSEIALVEDVAERTWSAMERASGEASLRESETRFRQFAASSSGALWVRDAATLEMEYTSPAIELIYGIAPDAILGDVRHWACHIVPEDREKALAHLCEARNGNAVTHEFRIQRASDGAFRWIRNTDFPLLDDHGRIQRIGGIAEDVTEAKQATEYQSILLHELQHRVRNTMAIVRSVAERTGDTVAGVEDYRDRLDGRLRALAHVQVLLTRAANAGVDLATLIRAEVEAQAEHAGQLTLSGPELLLSPKAAEVMTLAVHELTTNALKYGVLAQADGTIGVTWRVAYESEEPWLRFDWRETGSRGIAGLPARRGFGTELIEERIPYELDGRGSLSFEPEGLACHLTFPLRRGDSILETDGVTLSTTIEGGSLDMAGEADLHGCRILVVEDDFYLAADTARALKRVGGEVLGPVGKEDDALTLLAKETVTCALVDINLGNGLRFAVADALRERGVPFVFVTGYDDARIPKRFDDVPRMRKPTDFRQIVQAAARMCHSAPCQT